MTKDSLKLGYSSPECREVSISPQAQLLQVISNPAVTLDAFGIYDDTTDPYFG